MIAILVALSLFGARTTAQIPDPDRDLHIYALPVGQGDATVIQCPVQYGGSLVVIDMGSTKYKGFMGKDEVERWLNGQRVDAIYLTHPDRDHYNMMSAIGQSLAYGLPIYHTCEAKEYDQVSLDMLAWNARLIRIGRCVADDYDCDYMASDCHTYSYCKKKLSLRVLAAELNDCAGGGDNGDSMVIKVVYKGTSVLVLGDMEDKRDSPHFTKDGPYDILTSCADVRSDLMRLAHHGAYGKANKEDLFYKVNPHLVFSSSGFNPQYRHPRCEIFNFFHDWLDTSDGNQQVEANLANSTSLKHWYTCGISSSDDPFPWDSMETTMAIYTTSICDCNAENEVLRNYVIKMRVDSGTGDVYVSETEFSTYTEDNYPSGEDKFPCQNCDL